MKEELENCFENNRKKICEITIYATDNSNNLFYNGLSLISDLNKFSTIEFKKSINNQISILTVPQPAFNKKFNLLIDDLTNYSNKGYEIVIFCSSKNQIKRFK